MKSKVEIPMLTEKEKKEVVDAVFERLFAEIGRSIWAQAKWFVIAAAGLGIAWAGSLFRGN